MTKGSAVEVLGPKGDKKRIKTRSSLDKDKSVYGFQKDPSHPFCFLGHCPFVIKTNHSKENNSFKLQFFFMQIVDRTRDKHPCKGKTPCTNHYELDTLTIQSSQHPTEISSQNGKDKKKEGHPPPMQDSHVNLNLYRIQAPNSWKKISKE